MGFTIDDLMALQNRGLPDGLSQMTLACAARTEEQDVLAPANEAAGGEIEDQAAIHFRIEGEVEAVESPVGIPKARLLAPGVPAVGRNVASVRPISDTRSDC